MEFSEPIGEATWVDCTDTSFISLPQMRQAIEMGGAAEGGNSDAGMGVLPGTLGAVPRILPAARHSEPAAELAARNKIPPAHVDDVRPTRGHPNLMDALRLTEKAATDEISAIP